MQTQPKITIGMLVHNEDRYLAETLRSILAQDHDAFELIILDNASTDQTKEIVEQFAEQDNRIRYIRLETNQGAMKSWQQLIDMADGEFFALAAGHDLWSINYLRSLLARLEEDPTAVVSYAPAVWIDQEGERIPYTGGHVDTTGWHEVNRYLMVLWSDHNCMYGMYRTAALKETSYQAPHSIATESVILQELAARGVFRLASEATWFYRRVRENETVEARLARYYRAGFLFDTNRVPLMPFWRIPPAVIGAAFRAPVPRGSRWAMAACGLTSLIFLRAELISDIFMLPRRLGKYVRQAFAAKMFRRTRWQ